MWFLEHGLNSTINNIEGWDLAEQIVKISSEGLNRRGKLNLYGDILTVSSNNNEIENMIMKGDKAKYNQITKEGKKIYGEAKIIKYNISKDEIIFLKDSVVKQGANIVRSDKIIYKISSENITAGNKDGSSRVKMLFKPNKEK